MTTSAYPTLTQAEIAFKEVVLIPLIKAGELWLDGMQAPIPVLNFPALEGLEDVAIEAIFDQIFSRIILFIDVTAIRLKNAQLQSKWESSSEVLSLIAQEQGASSDAYKKALSQAASDFAAFVHTGGV